MAGALEGDEVHQRLEHLGGDVGADTVGADVAGERYVPRHIHHLAVDEHLGGGGAQFSGGAQHAEGFSQERAVRRVGEDEGRQAGMSGGGGEGVAQFDPQWGGVSDAGAEVCADGDESVCPRAAKGAVGAVGDGDGAFGHMPGLRSINGGEGDEEVVPAGPAAQDGVIAGEGDAGGGGAEGTGGGAEGLPLRGGERVGKAGDLRVGVGAAGVEGGDVGGQREAAGWDGGGGGVGGGASGV